MPSQDFSIKIPPTYFRPKPEQPTSSAQDAPKEIIQESASTETNETSQTPQGDTPVVDELYGRLPLIPTMEAAERIRFDFNDGLRVQFPETGGPWHIIFRDIDTGVILYSQDVGNNVYVTSVKKFYVRFRLEIYHKVQLDEFAEEVKKNPYLAGDEEKRPKPFFQHDYDAKGKTVMIQLPVPTIGDTLGWFPYVEKFRQKHKCHVLAVLQPHLADLLRDQYPEITFITRDEVPECQPYACYYLGLFFKGDVDHQPCDFRYIGLHRTAGWILGVDPTEERPRFNLTAKRQIEEPSVCIAVQRSSQAKYWNNPQGWHDVVKFLKDSGYRVLCIDRDRVYGQGLVWNHIPHGCEDFTGNIPLQERINLIKDADFFIGVSSGLSWLAWGCKVPVVMISGFTNPTNEFHTPYRIINFHTCNSCWNDMRVDFDHFDFLWCPRHKGTDRQFECSRLITSEQVIKVIKTIPTFRGKD
ncbi:MAG: autotransporter strand-loop-strand O-heptosyltransferase [Desulfovibrionaceae bacterium]|nr:autotransporter strand-loop-strand O-heptosyltransferase [Desulfovibrionaceae bacterium]